MAKKAGERSEEERQAAGRARTLRREIREADRAYYQDDAPIMDDAAYDALFAELRRLEADYPGVQTLTSPTRQVAGKKAEKFEPLRHPSPMHSLGNVFSAGGGARIFCADGAAGRRRHWLFRRIKIGRRGDESGL